jgi:DNA-binding beta-propeller fold protein YncE
VVASEDGKLAYISNYGGEGSAMNTISVVDLFARKPLRPIDLGALHSPHGLAFAGGKLYFTAETNKVIGRYDPATQRIDWVLGTGQDRTHMIVVANDLRQIVTSNVSSGTVSIIEADYPAEQHARSSCLEQQARRVHRRLDRVSARARDMGRNERPSRKGFRGV